MPTHMPPHATTQLNAECWNAVSMKGVSISNVAVQKCTIACPARATTGQHVPKKRGGGKRREHTLRRTAISTSQGATCCHGSDLVLITHSHNHTHTHYPHPHTHTQ